MKNKRLSELGEFGWLRSHLPGLYWPASLNSQLWIGPGDDAGALRITPGKLLVATTDAMVEGVHFETKWFPWEALGEKILAVNLSDLAAMGKVKPLAALATVAMPGDTPVDFVDKLYKGMETCAQRWKTGFLGGDTVGSKGPWFVSVTLLGEADPKHLVRRSGARVGDYIAATGPLGLAAAGLEVCQQNQKATASLAPLLEAFYRPQPRFAEGALLGEKHFATSLMDCSDGLEASVRLLAEASHCGAEIDVETLPIAPALERWAKSRKRPAWRYAFSGGEEYELIFTVPPEKWAEVKRRLPRAARLGRMLPAAAGVRALKGKETVSIKGYGYSHFH